MVAKLPKDNGTITNQGVLVTVIASFVVIAGIITFGVA